MSSTILPPALIAAVQEQRAILFLGAGASFGAVHPKGESPPLGNELRDKICEKFFKGQLKDRPLVAVAAMAAAEVGLIQFQRYIRELFLAFAPASFHELIPTFRWRAIASTNFDLVVERAYEKSRGAVQKLVTSVKDGDLFDTRMNAESDPVGYMKLHGCIDHYTDESIPLILGQEQYASYATNRVRFYSRLRDLAYENPIVFCGYSIADPHIQQLLFDLSERSIRRPAYYHVSPDLSDIEIRYWAGNQVTCIPTTFSKFLTELDKKISTTARRLPRDIGGTHLSIQSHYRSSHAQESESLRFYLRNDALHIHGGLVSDPQDAKEFYRGYDTGFGCILQDLDVRRAVTDSILVDAVLLDEAKGRSGELFLLKGPAGNGKTVTLKRVAWEAGTTYEQIALYVDQASGIRIDPIQEIFDLTGKRIFLFVDRIALFRDELLKFLAICRARKLPITVIGAERENEWHIYCDVLEPFAVQHFSIGYLELDEIERLLGALEKHQALGLLAERSRGERVEAFTKRAERQLLVALHETTLGIPFEKIVFDEFKRIRPAEAQRLYLDICALHQFGASVRAGLVSRTSGISFEDFGAEFLKPLADIVIVDLERERGDVFYRSRHQHVAELVFNQVLVSGEDKYDLLSSLIRAINIDYSSDRETFGRLVRGRAVADRFSSVELGRLLYDRAEEAAPSEYFVPHQRAVFELNHPSGSLVIAERAAERAARLNPKSQSVRHTQAEIARRQALESTDPLLKQSYRRTARERLAGDGARLSEYDLYTRAKVAIDELRDQVAKVGKQTDAANPALLAATKDAETAIQRGRTEFPESAEILTAEAAFREVLDQAPAALGALEHAFKLNPRQDWLAVRLAKRYEAKGEYDRAVKVIQTTLQENPDSKLGHFQMAQYLMRSEGNRERVIDHLRMSFVAGDNNFEAQFWYGRELFLAGRIPESETIFHSLAERAPGSFRTNAAARVDDMTGDHINYDGMIGRKEEGYAFVRLIDLGTDIFASRADSSRVDWDRVRTGSRVVCHLAFSRRGPRAVSLTPRNA